MDEQDSGVVEQVQATSEVQTAPPPAAAMPDRSKQIAGQLAELHKTIANGASWFYWVAGLSVINTLIALFHGSWSFLFGLGVTQVADAFIHEYGAKAALIGVPINLFIAAIYVLFGYCAHRRMSWAFYVGAIFYAFDGLLLLVAREWLSVAFHAWVLLSIIRGIKADSATRQLEAQVQRPVI